MTASSDPNQQRWRWRRRGVNHPKAGIEDLPESMHSGGNHALGQAYEPRTLAWRGGLREGLEDSLTAQQLGLSGALYRTLRTTNPIENLNGLVPLYTRNAKRWKNGAMALRWIANALVDASGRFRRLRVFPSMKTLLNALQQRAPAELEDTECKAA
jgi:hypothetical protein